MAFFVNSLEIKWFAAIYDVQRQALPHERPIGVYFL
jgi:hypothetical protein